MIRALALISNQSMFYTQVTDDTKLAAAESQVRMLEENLVLAEAHLKFAEQTADIMEEYPSAPEVLLAMYVHINCSNCGFHGTKNA